MLPISGHVIFEYKFAALLVDHMQFTKHIVAPRRAPDIKSTDIKKFSLNPLCLDVLSEANPSLVLLGPIGADFDPRISACQKFVTSGDKCKQIIRNNFKEQFFRHFLVFVNKYLLCCSFLPEPANVMQNSFMILPNGGIWTRNAQVFSTKQRNSEQNDLSSGCPGV